MSKRVGDIIKVLREQKGLTQKELSIGICTEQHLYRIEKSKRLPSAYLVNLLSKKLGRELIDTIYSSKCEW